MHCYQSVCECMNESQACDACDELDIGSTLT